MTASLKFDLNEKVILITGGAGLLGKQHAQAVAEAGGLPILCDIDEEAMKGACESFAAEKLECDWRKVDITHKNSIEEQVNSIADQYGSIHGLINNAANNPKVEQPQTLSQAGVEHFPLDRWQTDLSVGLTGAFLFTQVIGPHMANAQGGAIVNILSDLALISPDHRIYGESIKPPSYSAVKGGLLALTRYFGTYWAEQKVRVNAISPGGVYNGQEESFLERLTPLIPMGRMAQPDEYRSAIVFLLSDASSYMTGANLVIDGGRTAW